VIARRQRSLLPEDDFDIVEPAIGVVQLCPYYRGTAAATGSLGKAEIIPTARNCDSLGIPKSGKL